MLYCRAENNRPDPRMSITLFRTLVAVADEGSFAGAAEVVCVSNAAVGQQMRRLEDLLQVALFDRSRQPPRLNQLGMALVPKARALCRAYDTILDDLRGDATLIGDFTLGAVPSAIRGLIPISVKALVDGFPQLHVRVVPGMTDPLHAQVENGSLDAALISEPVRASQQMQWLPVADEPFVLLTSAQVEDDDPVRILASMPFIRHDPRASVGMLAEGWLLRNGVTVREVMEMGSLENLISMIAHNLGVSIVPDLCVPDPVFERLRRIPLPGEPLVRRLGLVMRNDCSKVRLVEELLDRLRRTIRPAHAAG